MACTRWRSPPVTSRNGPGRPRGVVRCKFTKPVVVPVEGTDVVIEGSYRKQDDQETWR